MRRLFIALGIFAAILLLPLVLMRSERSLLFLAHWTVDSFTDLRLVVRKPVLRPLKGLISADEIHLYPKTDDGPPFVSVLGLRGDINAADIYRGDLSHSRLSAEQVVIYVSSRDQTADPTPVQWLRHLSWLPEKLQVGQLHVVTNTNKTLVFPLREISGVRTEQTMFRATANALYEGEPLALELDLAAIFEGERAAGLEMAAQIFAPESGSSVALNGDLRGTAQDFSYNFQLDADYKEVSRFLEGFDTPGYLQGKLKLQARMQGNTEGFTLSNALFVLDNMPAYGIEAHGQLDYRFTGENQITLTAAGELTSLDAVLQWTDIDLRPLGRAQGSAKIVGTLKYPIIEDFILRSDHANGLSVNLRGHLDPQISKRTENRVRVDVHGPALATLEHWTGPLPHEPGPFSASGEIVGAENGLRLENFVAEAGSAEEFLLRMKGAASVTKPKENPGLSAVDQAALELSIFSPDSIHLSPFVPMDLPPGFEISGSVAVEGNGKELHISEGQLVAASSDIVASLKPTTGTLRLQDDKLLSNFAGELDLQLSDTSALSQFFTAPIPVLGGVSGRAKLLQRETRYSLEDIELALDGDGPKVRSTGRINDLSGLQGLVMEAHYSGIHARYILNTLMQDFNYAGELAELTGRLTLEHSGKHWSIVDFQLNTGVESQPLILEASGHLRDFSGIPAIALEVDYQLRDPALIEALTGLRTQPSEGQVKVRSRDGKSQAQGSARFGESRLDVKAELAHSNSSLQSLSLVIDSPLIHLNDLGLQQEKGDYNPSEQLEELEPGQRLNNALRRAPRYDTDIAINIDGLRGDNTNIERLNLHFTGSEQRYTLRRLSVAYGQSQTEVRGIIDLNSTPAFVSLAGELVAVPLDTLSKDLGMELNIRGIGNLRGGLTASGNSASTLLSSLDGSVAVALQDAVVEGAAYDVLATDLLAWFYSGAALEDSTHIDCTMGRFTLDRGVASSEGFYVETRKMVATGTAKLDLGRRSMDVKFTPRSKSRALQVPSSIRIRGDFDKPRVTVSPVAAAADAYAEVLSLLPQLARRIFGDGRRQKNQRPCDPDAA